MLWQNNGVILLLEFEDYYRNKGWWFLLQLLIAEQKCQHPIEYEAYCEQVFGYLYMPPPYTIERKKGSIYTHGTK
jgi:hypothetical protein